MARLPDNDRIYNGSAVYDLYSYQNGSAVRVRDYGTAAPEIQRPAGLPEERLQPQKKRRVKVKAAVSPFGVVGLAAVVCLMILVVFGYVQLYEATERVSDMESRIASLEEEQRILESLYEGAIDLDYIELRAAELGMAQPTDSQKVYVNLSGADRAEIYSREQTGWFARIFRAIESSASGLVEYLS